MNAKGPKYETRRASEAALTGRELSGYAVLWDRETRLGPFVETWRRGAFAESLGGRDVVALLDHDGGKVLGRVSSGTLELREDATGLRFVLRLPNTTAGNDVRELAERRDLGGVSIGFLPRPGGETWSRDGTRRELRAADLHEVSVISAWPAMEATRDTLALRNRPASSALRRARTLARLGG